MVNDDWLTEGGAAPWDLNSVAFPFKGHIEVNRNMGPSQSPHGFTGRNVPSFWECHRRHRPPLNFLGLGIGNKGEV